MGTTRPIYKKESHTEINNYRPITILACVDKIIEACFNYEVNKNLQTSNIINKQQYEFQQRQNTYQLQACDSFVHRF